MTLIPSGLLWTGLFIQTATAQIAPEEIYAWAAKPPAVQLRADESAMPAGKGAVFVPAISSSTFQTDVLIVDESGMSKGPTGRRILLAPGAYVLLVGSGRPEQRQGVQVVVQEGRTTVIPVTWGGLTVDVVNRRMQARPADYVLVRVATGEHVQVPHELQDDGTAPETWLLQPGLYRLEEDSASTVQNPVFATVYVPAGGLVNFRLFVNQSGAVVGGGVIDRSALDDTESPQENWRPGLVLGFDASGSQTQSVPGFADLTIGDASGFASFEIGYANPRHLLDLDAEAVYGLMLVQPGTGAALPLIKTRDRLEGSGNYTFLLNEGVGIYARGQLSTQMTETKAIAAEDTTVEYRNLDGSVTTQNVGAAETYTLADGFSPLLGSVGTGLRARLSTARDVRASLSGGLGYRASNYGGAFVPTDNPNTPALEFTEVADFFHPGAEAGIQATFHLRGVVKYETHLDAFAAFNNSADVGIWWDNDVNFRITRALSLSYRLNAARVPWVTDQLIVRQGLYFRLAYSIL